MGFTVWLSVLCLQASLLSHALDCSAATQGELGVSAHTADTQVRDAAPGDQVVQVVQGVTG